MNHTTYSAGQSPQWDCLCHHVTCVFFPGETKKRFPVTSSVDGKTLAAYRVNRFNGKRLKEKEFHLLPDSKVELFASPWPDLFFAVEIDRYRGRYTCSCEVPYCEHIRQMMAISRQQQKQQER